MHFYLFSMLKKKIILILSVPRLNVSVKNNNTQNLFKEFRHGVCSLQGCWLSLTLSHRIHPHPTHPLIPAALWPASLFLCASRECFFKPWQTRYILRLYPICGHNYLSYATSHWDLLVEVKPVFPLGFWKTHMERVHRNRKANGPSQ